MKATSLLEKQHRKVEAEFKKLESGLSDPAPVLIELANNLAAHRAIEQEIFYLAIRTVAEKLVLESYEEHSLAEVALKRLLAIDPEDEAFAARVTAVEELIGHHVKEEEENLFPHVEKVLDEARLLELGQEKKARFEEAYEAGFEVLVPSGVAKTPTDVSKKVLKKMPKSSAAWAALNEARVSGAE